jgi:hypothetical protein
VLACRIKDGQRQDAEELLGLYLDALDEELVELHTFISTHKPASTSSVEELDEEAQSAEGRIEVRKREYTVRQLFFFSLRWAWRC